MNEAVLPVLREKGIDPVETALIDAPATDQTATIAAAQTIAERFKQSGAERVLVVGNAAVAFGRGVARTDYRPTLVFDNLNAAQTYGQDQTNDLSILDGAITGGTFGPQSARLALDNAATTECLATQRGAGLTILPSVPKGQPDQFASSSVACQQVYLLMAILEKAGPDLNYGTFRAAGDSLGPVDLPTFPDGTFTFGPPPAADGDPTIYPYVYDPAASAFVPATS